VRKVKEGETTNDLFGFLTTEPNMEVGGARWIGDDSAAPFRRGGTPAFVTRLHVRYDAKSFPEDIAFQETYDRENFQGRYVLRHPWQGNASCPAAQAYRGELPMRFAEEAANLVELTGWARNEVEMENAGQSLKR